MIYGSCSPIQAREIFRIVDIASQMLIQIYVIYGYAGLFTVDVQSSTQKFLGNRSIPELENMMEHHRQNPGEIQIIEVISLKPNEIIIGQHRTVYISSVIGSFN